MKKLFLILLIVNFLAGSTDAQIHLFLQEQEVDLKDSKSSAWVFPVARGLDEALDDMKQYCKDRSDIRMKKGGENMVIGEKVSVPTIATKRGDMIGYGFITENYYGIAMVFQLGYDISINSQEWAVEMKNFRNYAKEFMSYHYEQSYSRRIKALEKEIKSQQKQINQNENKIESLNKKIENLNKKIEKETDEAKISTFQSDITTMESDIQELTDVIPQLRTQVQNFQNNVDKLKAESHAFQNAIGSI